MSLAIHVAWNLGQILLMTHHMIWSDILETEVLLDFFRKLKEISFVYQMDEDSQISKYTQTEEDQYEMQVRAANIVCINISTCIEL